MKRAALVAIVVLLLLPALASATSSCGAAPGAGGARGAGTDFASALFPSTPSTQTPPESLSPVESLPMLNLSTSTCDKQWCSDRRAECRTDCLPCTFSFTCFVLDCKYICICNC